MSDKFTREYRTKYSSNDDNNNSYYNSNSYYYNNNNNNSYYNNNNSYYNNSYSYYNGFRTSEYSTSISYNNYSSRPKWYSNY